MTAISRMTDQEIKRLGERVRAGMEIYVSECLLEAQTPPDVEVGQKYYNDSATVYIAAVIHRRNDYGVWISTDGDPQNAVRIPIRVGSWQIEMRHVSDVNEFVVAVLPGWLANGRTGEYARPPIVQAKSPQLCDRIQWSERQRTAWKTTVVWREKIPWLAKEKTIRRRKTAYYRRMFQREPTIWLK